MDTYRPDDRTVNQLSMETRPERNILGALARLPLDSQAFDQEAFRNSK